ncbi:hypothetical protein [Streptomyces sp. NPDC058045]|uniref:hypothetical protein n=1 Tax=Streptomyces sp. NPDC058045 TaxID=3346311 RepID=UPI0036E9D946
MQMNSAPHLLNEDRRDVERLLDEALRSAPSTAGATRPLSTGQLRTMALGAIALITAAASDEYREYVKIRTESRTRPARTAPAAAPPARGTAPLGVAAGGVAGGFPGAGRTGPADPGGPAGAGLAAVVTVLAPVLAGAAAVIFLLAGWLLGLLDPAPGAARTLLVTGWVFTALTAAAILLAAVGLLLTALRNGSTSLRAADTRAQDEELARAREAWHRALLDRGILPFLRDALAEPVSGASRDRRAEGGQLPHLGYHRPGFTSPGGEPSTGSHPTFSSPDFTSPDFGGPEHQPD